MVHIRKQRKTLLNDGLKRLVFYSSSHTHRKRELEMSTQLKYQQGDHFYTGTGGSKTTSSHIMYTQKALESWSTNSLNTSYTNDVAVPPQKSGNKILQDSNRANISIHTPQTNPKVSKTYSNYPYQDENIAIRPTEPHHNTINKSSSYNGPKSMEMLNNSVAKSQADHLQPLSSQRPNSVERTDEITERRSKMLSDKTKTFLQNFDLDRYMDKVRRKSRGSAADLLNKSDNMINSDTSISHLDKVNQSVNLGLNLNNTIVFK